MYVRKISYGNQSQPSDVQSEVNSLPPDVQFETKAGQTSASDTKETTELTFPAPTLTELAALSLIAADSEMVETEIEKAIAEIEKANQQMKRAIKMIDASEKMDLEGAETQISKHRAIVAADPVDDPLLDEIHKIYQTLLTLIKLIKENQVKAVDELLTKTPPYLLAVLFKKECIVTTYAKGLNNYMVVRGTLLKIALGEEAVGRDGSNLCLIPSSPNSPFLPSDLNRLILHSDNDPTSPFRYCVDGKEWKIESNPGFRRRNKQALPDSQLIRLDEDKFNTLKKMFANPKLCNQYLNLTTLDETQQDACAALLNVTRIKGHTYSIQEEGMVEVFQRHMRRVLGKEGAEEIARQTLEQFPAGWKKEDDAQYKRDLEALKKIREAISVSKTNNDPELKKAFEEFKNHFEPRPENLKVKGKYGRARLLETAFKLGLNYFDDSQSDPERRKDLLYFENVVGWLQKLEPFNRKQTIVNGENYKTTHFKHREGWMINFDSPNASGIGFDSWFSSYERRGVNRVHSVKSDYEFCSELHKRIDKTMSEHIFNARAYQSKRIKDKMAIQGKLVKIRATKAIPSEYRCRWFSIPRKNRTAQPPIPFSSYRRGIAK